jgi:hypothetical protein
MGARQRLNSVYFIGFLIVAAIIGGVVNSWAVFCLVAGVLIASAIHGGDIRVSPKTPHRTNRRQHNPRQHRRPKR